MRSIIALNDGWRICQADGLRDAALERLIRGADCGGAVTWYPSPVPTSVQDILCRNGVIPASARNGGEDLR